MRAPLRHERRELTSRKIVVLAVPRLALFALLWLVLTESDPEGWYIGVLFVVAGTLGSIVLRPDYRWRLTLGGSARFAPFFLRESLFGGTDVAVRAMRPSMPLEPELVEYRSRLSESGPRIFMTSVISLLPGTLSAELEDRNLRIHSLVGARQAIENVQYLEVRVADLFGVELDRNGGTREEEPENA
ncbi:MAG: Na+/H+ antiporter subunit E [Rubrobacter sp.]|nr:Na+/H+ antiporter subunit E [Rubrobacter sp.]